METDVIGGESDLNFYQKLEAFHQFELLTDSGYYKKLPDDWLVGVADIQNSTELLTQGNYRIVNIVGVSAIVGMLNHHTSDEIPFVFGGDGCLIAVPKTSKNILTAVLKATAYRAKKQFGVHLRTAVYSARDINAQKPLLVAKYQVSDNYSQAILSGGGADLAEKWLKSKPETLLEPGDSDGVSFNGLECRWKPVKSPSGITLTILLKAQGDRPEKEQLNEYQDFFSYLNDLPSVPKDRHPIREDQMQSEIGLINYKTEVEVRTGQSLNFDVVLQTLKSWALTMIGIVMMKRGTKTSETDWSVYKSDLVKNADIRKFDDMLRMVISCTEEQEKRIEHYLESKRKMGKLNFGVHSSDSALITCMVFKYHKKHIHFVDGNDGGYTSAAAMLKKQLKN